MRHIIFFVGISASGKTTASKSFSSSTHEVVERDVIRRNTFGLDYQIDPKKEKQVSEIQKQKILSAWNNNKIAVVSDTNLNVSFSNFLGLTDYTYEVIPFPDSHNFDLCYKRNDKREAWQRVPDKVLLNQYYMFQDLFRTSLIPSYSFKTSLDLPVLVVSDLHGRFSKLTKIVDEYWGKVHFLFLGDLNDSTNPKDSSLHTLSYCKVLSGKGLATVLHSNHQQKLCDVFFGQRVKCDEALRNTLEEFNRFDLADIKFTSDGDIDRQNSDFEKSKYNQVGSVLRWLATRPTYARVEGVFKDRPIVAAHAYVSPSLEKYPYTLFGNKSVRAKAIYGPTDEGHNRLDWTENYESNMIPIVGHYHKIKVCSEGNYAILDPEDPDVIATMLLESNTNKFPEIKLF